MMESLSDEEKLGLCLGWASGEEEEEETREK